MIIAMSRGGAIVSNNLMAHGAAADLRGLTIADGKPPLRAGMFY
jgi:hypothetical protein